MGCVAVKPPFICFATPFDLFLNIGTGEVSDFEYLPWRKVEMLSVLIAVTHWAGSYDPEILPRGGGNGARLWTCRALGRHVGWWLLWGPV